MAKYAEQIQVYIFWRLSLKFAIIVNNVGRSHCRSLEGVEGMMPDIIYIRDIVHGNNEFDVEKLYRLCRQILYRVELLIS